ncbi:MAG TPA: hydroxymethylglutaryl-CoA reductase (NADPH), partial [bacterium]|nr:hydroxymethylglutaryl-CoA reductase (NADPH) [bacterium]
FDEAIVSQKNIENLIGATQIPLAVTTPIKIEGQFARGEFYIPMATTEKSLVASTSRGCRALTLSGGVRTRILQDKMTRAPLFKIRSVDEGLIVKGWIENNLDVLQNEISKNSAYTRLEGVRTWITGRNLFTRFEFTTGDAMGMNMATRATDIICRFLLNRFPNLEWIAISSNMCVDKKPSAINFIEGRGKTVIAEAELPAEVVSMVLKTDVEALEEVNYRKNLIGSAMAGSLGFNAHFANIVAAIFIATGQDVAQVVSGSMGFTLLEKGEGDPPSLHASVTMPTLEVATVGGGTRLESQRDALDLLGVRGTGNPPGTNAKKLAEIIAATVLAGELSLLSAQAEHTLAKAHSV